MKIKILFLIIATTLFIPLSCSAEEIGLQFLVKETVTDYTQRENKTKKINAIVNEVNSYFLKSGVNLYATVNYIAFQPIRSNDTVTILQEMYERRGDFITLAVTADEYGADFTIAIADGMRLNGKNACGRGYDVNQTVEEISQSKRAVAVIQLVCGAHTLAHELGHLMGLNHGFLINSCIPGKGHTSAIEPYANGYAEGNCDGRPQAGEFGTIMVGGWIRNVNGHNKSSVEIFSNPDIYNKSCGKKGRCGDLNSANAAKALNKYAKIYASHEEPDVHTLFYKDNALKECMRKNYKRKEVTELKKLTCQNFKIKSLTGLEQLNHLETIDFSNNEITSIIPIMKTPPNQLTEINLEGNITIPCREIKTLKEYAKDAHITEPKHCLEKLH
ncbi:MAG: hypothetical protein HQK84_09930 [Nitrospinae bacterium]|nr:hypothetical protein [Nitrospinota bacterium]